MLALRTGWTPDVIGGDAPGGVTDSFRRACHWALFAESLTPVLDQVREAAAADPSGGDPKEFARLSRARLDAQKAKAAIEAELDIAGVDED